MRSQKISKQPAAGPRAFTLLEMLTVIAILAILIAIIIPAINGARNAARKTDTRVQMVGVTQGIAAFQQDNKRLPGYFSPRQMGTVVNGTARGFTQMENMMIDLLGGVSTQNPDGTAILAVGPGSSAGPDQVALELAAMGAATQSKTGATSKSYLAFDAKRYVVQNAPGARGGSGPGDNAKLPVLVDSFGQPILAWVADENVSGTAFAASDVAAASGTNGAKYYRAQNAGFLDATVLGKQKENQLYAQAGSVLASDNTPANIASSMEALLGNAAQPDPSAPAATPKPLAIRAPVVLHSAGLDGVYVGKRDKGARSGVVPYRPNQDAFGGTLFDDIIVTGGN